MSLTLVGSPNWMIGVDVGTQSLKVALSDDKLRVVALAAESYDVVYPQAGWAEQDPRAWEAALPRAIAAVLQQAGIAASRVGAIGIAGQLDGCVAIDRDGNALGNALIWMDRRAVKQARLVDPELVQRTTGIRADASHMAAKIAWLKDAGVNAWRFHQPVSYLVSRLTGRHVFDHGLASTTMIYSLEARDYDAALLAGFGITREELPEIAPAESLAGRLTAQGARLTGLLEGIAVAVGTGDDFSGPLGAGLVAPGRMIGVLGTAEVVGAVDCTPKIDVCGLVETHRYIGSDWGDTYFIENPGWLSGGALTWFQNTFRLKNVEELDELASRAPAGSDGLLFLPALSGAMAPEWNENARGCFYGLTAAHGVSHMARSVLEGCAYAMRDVLERLREMSVPVDAITLSGGGAKSALWAQIRADVCELPVSVSEFAIYDGPRTRHSSDSSPVGALMLAAVAGGLQPSLAACANNAARESERARPDAARVAIYKNSYARYRKLFESLRPLYDSQDEQ